MNKSFLVIVPIFISLFFFGCESKKIDNIVENPTPPTIKDPTFTVDNSVKPEEEVTPPPAEVSPPPKTETPKVETPKQVTYGFLKVTYTENNAEINFPEITGLNDTTKENTINTLIKDQVLEYFYLYIKNKDTNSKVDFKIILANENLLSICYSGLISSPDLPYQGHLIYTTNIDLNTGKKIRLTDLISASDNLLQFIDEKHLKEAPVPRSKDVKDSAMNDINAEKNAVNDIPNYSYNLLYRLSIADEKFGVLSYFTENSVVICTYFPYNGAYPLEFEIKFEEIASNIKTENELWRGLRK